MWYDATSRRRLAGGRRTPRSRARSGYVAAPVVETDSSGWLYAWSWGIQQASEKKDNAWKFISWASSKEYEELVGHELGWSRVPAGKRASTYENPDYVAGGRRRSPSRPEAPSRAPTREPRRPAAAGARHPVRRHPRVPRPGHPGLPGRQLGDRRPDDASTRRWTAGRSSPRTSPSATERGSAVTADGGLPRPRRRRDSRTDDRARRRDASAGAAEVRRTPAGGALRRPTGPGARRCCPP